MAQSVKFKFGTFEEYTAADPKDENSLYFTTDSLQLFKGDKEYTKPLKMVDELPETGVIGESYFVKGDNTVHVYDGTEFKAVTYPLSTTMGEEPSDTKVLTEKAVQDAITKAVESIEVTGGEISWEPIA